MQSSQRGIALITFLALFLAYRPPAFTQDSPTLQGEARARALMVNSDSDAAAFNSPQGEVRARALMANSDSDAAAFNSPQGEARARALMANSDSAAAAFHAAVRRLTSVEFEQRKARRLEFQRRGYATILHELLRQNGPGAFLAMVRTKAQLDIYLPQNTLMVTVPVLGPPSGDPRLEIFAPPSTPPMSFPLIEDRRFPENPWRK